MLHTHPNERLLRVLDLCRDVLEQPGAQRMVHLSRVCDGDFRLRASVESVLIALKDARDFMDIADIRADNFAAYVGEDAGQYRLDELLGISPLGAMYQAVDTEGAPVAVRVVRGHLWAREVIERFSDEAADLARVRDPAVATLLDGGVSRNGSPFLVYEFVDGVALDQYCDERRLDVPKRVALLSEVCRGAHVGHTHLSAWRSLRPSNVLVDQNGQPKLLDFGLATLMHRQHGPVRVRDSMMQTIWLSQFAAPEVFDESLPTVQADVYSLGAMAFELVTGQRLASPVPDAGSAPQPVMRASDQVRANNDVALREAIARRRGTTTKALVTDLEGTVDTVIARAVAQSPANRFASASALAQALGGDGAGQVTSTGHATTPVERRPNAHSRRGGFWWGVAVGSLLFTALLMSVLA
ncbi:MAG: serine/threonine-protein kinase [Pseudomonadota bacterium]